MPTADQRAAAVPRVIYPPTIAGLTDDIATTSYRLALDVRKRSAVETGMPYSTYVGDADEIQPGDAPSLRTDPLPWRLG